MITAFNLNEKFQKINEYWTPKIVGELNGQLVKLAKLKGDFVWHSHEAEDELFQIVKGTLLMEFRDQTTESHPGDILIVPRGVEHRPRTLDGQEVWVMLFEPKATKHTGAIDHELTVHDQEWI
ncbi:MAG: cupin domain-containing protein [Bacteroidota bacterium]